MEIKIPYRDEILTVPDSTKIIWASKIYPVLVDESDYEYLSKIRWSIKPSRLTYYVQGILKINGENKLVRMHRLIMGFPDGMAVHHKNHHGWVNTRDNLEVITFAQNAADQLPNGRFPRFYREYSAMRKIPVGIRKSEDDDEMWVAYHNGVVIGEYYEYENAVTAHDYYVCMKYGKRARPIMSNEKQLILQELSQKGYFN